MCTWKLLLLNVNGSINRKLFGTTLHKTRHSSHTLSYPLQHGLYNNRAGASFRRLVQQDQPLLHGLAPSQFKSIHTHSLSWQFIINSSVEVCVSECMPFSVSVLFRASVTPNFKYGKLLHARNWLKQVPWRLHVKQPSYPKFFSCQLNLDALYSNRKEMFHLTSSKEIITSSSPRNPTISPSLPWQPCSKRNKKHRPFPHRSVTTCGSWTKCSWTI